MQPIPPESGSWHHKPWGVKWLDTVGPYLALLNSDGIFVKSLKVLWLIVQHRFRHLYEVGMKMSPSSYCHTCITLVTVFTKLLIRHTVSCQHLSMSYYWNDTENRQYHALTDNFILPCVAITHQIKPIRPASNMAVIIKNISPNAANNKRTTGQRADCAQGWGGSTTAPRSYIIRPAPTKRNNSVTDWALIQYAAGRERNNVDQKPVTYKCLKNAQSC